MISRRLGGRQWGFLMAVSGDFRGRRCGVFRGRRHQSGPLRSAAITPKAEQIRERTLMLLSRSANDGPAGLSDELIPSTILIAVSAGPFIVPFTRRRRGSSPCP